MEIIYIRAGRSHFICGNKNADGAWCHAGPYTRAASVKRHVQKAHSHISGPIIPWRKIELNSRQARSILEPYSRDGLLRLLYEEFKANRLINLPSHLQPRDGAIENTSYSSNNRNNDLEDEPASLSQLSAHLPPPNEVLQTNDSIQRPSRSPLSIESLLNPSIPRLNPPPLSSPQTFLSTRSLGKRRHVDDIENITPPPKRRQPISFLMKTTNIISGIPQVKALDWLSGSSYVQFDKSRRAKLTMWGRSKPHLDHGPCLLWPADWNGLSAEVITELLINQHKTFPKCDDYRLTYRYNDHMTSFTRAQAWYSEWPRSLEELAIFTDCCDPKNKVEGSHLCHRPNCLLHLTLESPQTNEDRKRCHVRAIQLRRCGLPVPAECQQHQPPCLMQHAALTNIEACLIQISVFQLSKAFTPLPTGRRPERPVNHTFATFETSLPLRFPTEGDKISITADDLVIADSPQLTAHDGLSQVCGLCEHIKHMTSFRSFARHIIRIHGDVSPGRKIAELRKSANYWHGKFRDSAYGEARVQKTRDMIGVVRSAHFQWSMVEGWGIGSLNEDDIGEQIVEIDRNSQS